jgi:hypothetical protein
MLLTSTESLFVCSFCQNILFASFRSWFCDFVTLFVYAFNIWNLVYSQHLVAICVCPVHFFSNIECWKSVNLNCTMVVSSCMLKRSVCGVLGMSRNSDDWSHFLHPCFARYNWCYLAVTAWNLIACLLFTGNFVFCLYFTTHVYVAASNLLLVLL